VPEPEAFSPLRRPPALLSFHQAKWCRQLQSKLAGCLLIACTGELPVVQTSSTSTTAARLPCFPETFNATPVPWAFLPVFRNKKSLDEKGFKVPGPLWCVPGARVCRPSSFCRAHQGENPAVHSNCIGTLRHPPIACRFFSLGS